MNESEDKKVNNYFVDGSEQTESEKEKKNALIQAPNFDLVELSVKNTPIARQSNGG